MTFFKAHLQRKASDRKRAVGLDTIMQPPKPECPSASRVSLPETENRGSIEIEVERLFQHATDACSSIAPAARNQHDHGPARLEAPLFLKFMKRRENPTTSATPRDGSKRTFSHRGHSSKANLGNLGDNKAIRNSTPDLIREGSYDSDALCIASPRFSTQSWESLHTFSPLRMNITTLAPPDEKKPETISKENSDIIVLPPPERRQQSALSIPKRRGQHELHIEKGYRSRSLLGAEIVNNEGNKVDMSPVAVESLRKKSRFTEMFHHVGLEDASSSQPSRKVSVGWMSEGKRCGYGYSFVDIDETIDTSCEPETFVDDSAEAKAKAKASSKDLTILDCKNTDKADLFGEGETCLPDHGDKGVSLEIETVNIPDKLSRWTTFPSHTRSARNDEPAYFENGIIARDFCTQASPDRPEHDNNPEEKKRHLMANVVRQGVLDTFLWMIGLGKREIARYHAGLEVKAARSYDCQDPMFEMTVPYWDHAPKEELGSYHMEAWKAAMRRSRQQRRLTTSRNKAAHLATTSGSTRNVPGGSFLNSDGGKQYIGRRHSSTF